MDTSQLVYVMASGVFAADRIEDEGCMGNRECKVAAGASAGFIRAAIEADRANRKKRLF